MQQPSDAHTERDGRDNHGGDAQPEPDGTLHPSCTSNPGLGRQPFGRAMIADQLTALAAAALDTRAVTEPSEPAPSVEPAAPVPVVPGTSGHTLAELMPAPAVPTTPKRRVWPVLLGVVALVLIAGLGATVIVLLTRDPAATPAAEETTTRPAPVAAPPWTPPANYWPDLSAKDIALTVKVMEQKCYGSAGCSVTFRIELAYSGPKLEPGKDWDVTYTVSGAEDPIINTLKLTGIADGYTYSTEREERTSTEKSSSKLTAQVTSVSPH